MPLFVQKVLTTYRGHTGLWSCRLFYWRASS